MPRSSPQFVLLNRERDKVAAVTSSGHWGERQVAVNRKLGTREARQGGERLSQ